MNRNKRIENLILDIYRELYKQSTPSADFDELVNNASLNERGQKIIDYNSHELEHDKFEVIINQKIKEHKIRLKDYEKKRLTFQVYLGCSPKSK